MSEGSEVYVGILDGENAVGGVGGNWGAIVVVGVVWFMLVDPVEAPAHCFGVGGALAGVGVIVVRVLVCAGVVVPGDVPFRSASVFVRGEDPIGAVVEVEEWVSVS